MARNSANFTTSATEGTLFQMGVYWESSPNTDYLTNTLEATNAVADGDVRILSLLVMEQKLGHFIQVVLTVIVKLMDHKREIHKQQEVGVLQI